MILRARTAVPHFWFLTPRNLASSIHLQGGPVFITKLSALTCKRRALVYFPDVIACRLASCQTSETRMCARLEIRTGRLVHEAFLAGLRAPLSSLRLSRSTCCKQVESGGTRHSKAFRKARAERAKCRLAHCWLDS